MRNLYKTLAVLALSAGTLGLTQTTHASDGLTVMYSTGRHLEYAPVYGYPYHRSYRYAPVYSYPQPYHRSRAYRHQEYREHHREARYWSYAGPRARRHENRRHGGHDERRDHHQAHADRYRD